MKLVKAKIKVDLEVPREEAPQGAFWAARLIQILLKITVQITLTE